MHQKKINKFIRLFFILLVFAANSGLSQPNEPEEEGSFKTNNPRMVYGLYEELWLEILDYLDPQSFIAAKKVCKDWLAFSEKLDLTLELKAEGVIKTLPLSTIARHAERKKNAAFNLVRFSKLSGSEYIDIKKYFHDGGAQIDEGLTFMSSLFGM